MTPQQYYQQAELWLPKNPQWRQWKFIRDGHIFIIPDRIRNAEILRKWILRTSPDHIYYSLSSWLSPVEVRQNYLTKAGNVLLSKAVIAHDFKFDIDQSTLQEAKQSTIEIMDFFKSKGLKFQLIYSGKKGFHIELTDWKFDIPPKIKDREGEILDQKSFLINEMQERNLDFDTNISLDLRRIIRLPTSIHNGTGNICEIIDPKEIENYEPRNIMEVKN